MNRIFVTAIGTDCGKTLVSAILCEALGADYWKPVQAGLPRDSDTVASLVSGGTTVHQEAYLLKTPASPHAAAKIDDVVISIPSMVVPDTTKDLVIEGAGGCLVPLNDKDFVIDLAGEFNCEVVLVSNLYLGSINHTLLTANLLQQRKLKVKGIIFNGPSNPESERIILHHTKFPLLLQIGQEATINKDVVQRYAEILRKQWK